MNMYQTLYDLINQLIYNGAATLGTIEGDVATLVATFGVVMMIVIPFRILYNAVDFMCGGFRR